MRKLCVMLLLLVGCGRTPDDSVSAQNINEATKIIAYARSQDIGISPLAEKQLLIVISNALQTAEDRGYQQCESDRSN